MANPEVKRWVYREKSRIVAYYNSASTIAAPDMLQGPVECGVIRNDQIAKFMAQKVDKALMRSLIIESVGKAMQVQNHNFVSDLK